MTIPDKPLRILLSAYACEPGKGSEPGVGWNWALGLARRGHEVWVLTRSNNRHAIEHELAKSKQPSIANLHFLYYDVPKWASWWKKGGRGVHLYYFLWQLGVYLLAKKWHQLINFELVHHVTFVSVRQPSFLGNLNIPFIFGPVAGGECVPFALRKGFSLRGWVIDAARDIANVLVRLDPFMHMTFSQAQRIYTTSEQTKRLVPNKYISKTEIQLAIATEEIVASSIESNHAPAVKSDQILHLLYVGNFIQLKGMQIGIEAFSLLLKNRTNIRLTMVGEGPEGKKWRDISKQLGVDMYIDWLPRMNQCDLQDVYKTHDVMLFPSLRDSGGMVVLEALSNGLPVVCFKLGGPGVTVDNTCGRAVDVSNDDLDTATNKLTNALLELADCPKLRKELSRGALLRAEKLTWNAAVASIYDGIEEDLIKTMETTNRSNNPVNA